MDSMVKKSLAVPIKKLTCCVSGVKDGEAWTKQWGRSRQSQGGRTRAAAPHPAQLHDPSFICSYQADFEKDRKLREAMNAQKNAERATLRAHFRRKYQLSKNSKDASQMREVGRKVKLPRELAKMVQSDAPAKDEGYSLLSMFQGLSFNMGVLSGGTKSGTPTLANGEPCKVI